MNLSLENMLEPDLLLGDDLLFYTRLCESSETMPRLRFA